MSRCQRRALQRRKHITTETSYTVDLFEMGSPYCIIDKRVLSKLAKTVRQAINEANMTHVDSYRFIEE